MPVLFPVSIKYLLHASTEMPYGIKSPSPHHGGGRFGGCSPGALGSKQWSSMEESLCWQHTNSILQWWQDTTTHGEGNSGDCRGRGRNPARFVCHRPNILLSKANFADPWMDLFGMVGGSNWTYRSFIIVARRRTWSEEAEDSFFKLPVGATIIGAAKPCPFNSNTQ